MDINSSDLELVNEPRHGAQAVGLRFNGLNIPQGAQIVGAYIQFTVDETRNEDPCNLTIYGEASDNAALFSNTDFELSSRPRTSASVAWSPSSWLAVGDAGGAQRTVDISAVIQEIVNRSGYTSSSSIAIFIEGTGRRVAESVDGGPAGAPQLCVDFFDTPPNYDCPGLSAFIGDPCDDGDNTTVNDMVDAGCGCAGQPTACTGIGDADGDGVCADVDCDDNDAAVTTVDADGDGLCGDIDCDDNDPAVTSTNTGDADCDGVPSGLDCDDSDPTVTSANTGDADCDGVPTAEDCDDNDPTVTTTNTGDADCDGVPTAEDCDDNDPALGSNADDMDCDGLPSSVDCDDSDAAIAYQPGDACDDGNPATYGETIQADCSCGGGSSEPISACASIETNFDDVEEYPNGHIDENSSDLELVNEPRWGMQSVGLRFNGLNIPQGAQIVNAYIQFTVDEPRNDNPCNLVISGQASDNAAIFTNDDFNVSSRPRTGASVAWSPASWLSVGAAGPAQQTPDLSAVLQEIVDRSGYTSASSIVLIIEGTGRRVAESVDGGPAGAPQLCVDYLYSPSALSLAPPTGNTPIEDAAIVAPGLSPTLEMEEAPLPANNEVISPIRVHPNPANTKLMVTFNSMLEGEVRIQARNMSGQVVLIETRKIEQGRNTIALEGLSLPGGLYFLQLFAENTAQSAKFIIQKD